MKAARESTAGVRFAGRLACLVLVVALQPAVCTRGDDWSRFRGPDGAGISEAAAVPAALDAEKNLLWKVNCPPGTSSPIVVGNRLFLTALRGDERLVQCLDGTTGETRWTKSVRKQRDEVATPPCGPATPTPAADASNVYAFFTDFGLVCYSHEGEDRWRVTLGPFQSFHGVSSSLVVAEGRVIVLVDQLQDSFLAADGRLLLIDTEGRIAVVRAGAEWDTISTSELGEECYTTPAIAGGRIYIRGERNLFCFGTSGDPRAGNRHEPRPVRHSALAF